MESPLYIFSQIGFGATTIIFFWLVVRQLKIGLLKSNFERAKQSSIVRKVVIALFIWMVTISGLSLSNFFSDFSTTPPRFVILIFVPLITLVWALLFSKTTKHILALIPAETIIRLQVFRVIVEILLWLLFIQNLLPVQMTFEGRNFDILAGLTAPAVAFLAHRKVIHRKALIVWNVLCLGLLINIVGTAILSLPTPFRYFMNEPANTIVAEFPFIWLPGFLVPLAYGLHFLSLRQLANQKN